MSLQFVSHGISSISDAATLSECLALGLNEIEKLDRDGRLWASQVAHCPRKGALEATSNSNRPWLAASQVYCEIGNTVEDLIIKAWEKQGRLLFTQYKLPTIREFKKLNLGGYIDAIALQDNKIRAVEIKTCGNLPITPREDQKAQLMLYSAFTGLPSTLFYFSREVASWDGKLITKQFDFDYDAEELMHYMFNAVFARFCVDKGIIPNKSSKITKKSHCLYCNFTDFCWNEAGLLAKNIPQGSTLVIPEGKDTISLAKKALKITIEIMKSENVVARNNGILKHLSRHGTKTAKELLSGKTWPRDVR